jgi:hypothetical protein
MSVIIACIVWLYAFPLWTSILYFSILKVEDIGRTDKIFSYKLPFYVVILTCFIPGLNILYYIKALWDCLTPIQRPKV